MSYLDYLPSFLAELRQFQAIGGAEDGVMEEAESQLRSAGDDFYVETMTETALARWESMLGLSSGNGTELGERRFRLLTYLIPQTPFTMLRLQEMLADLCGEDGYALSWDGVYTLVVRIALASRVTYSAVVALLERVAPANLVLDISLMYNIQSFVATATHQTLASYTHESIKEEERTTWQL